MAGDCVVTGKRGAREVGKDNRKGASGAKTGAGFWGLGIGVWAEA